MNFGIDRLGSHITGDFISRMDPGTRAYATAAVDISRGDTLGAVTGLLSEADLGINVPESVLAGGLALAGYPMPAISMGLDFAGDALGIDVSVSDMVNGFVDNVGLRGTVDIVSNALDGAADVVSDVASAAGDAISGALSSVGDAIGGAVDAVASALSGDDDATTDVAEATDDDAETNDAEKADDASENTDVASNETDNDSNDNDSDSNDSDSDSGGSDSGGGDSGGGGESSA